MCGLFQGTTISAQTAVTMIDRGTLGGIYSVATAINDAGQVIGDSYTAGDVATHAFSWTAWAGMRDLGTLGDSRSSPTALFNVTGAAAAPGDLDPTFDTDGKVTTSFNASGDEAQGVAIQADGKIVVAGYCPGASSTGDFCLARYNLDGSLDSSFDTDGKVTTAIGTQLDQAWAVAIQGDGKIVAAGSCSVDFTTAFCLARYNVDGSLDTSFDSDGRVISRDAYLGSIHALAILGGKIVAAGSCQAGAVHDFCLARYNSDGGLDTSFDTDGRVTTDIATHDNARAVVIQGDGKIVAVGSCGGGGAIWDICLARYNANGSLDTSFDTDGKATTAVGAGADHAEGAAIQGDGKIVVVGTCQIGSQYDFCLARYNVDGRLDTSFSSDGMVTTHKGNSIEVFWAVAIQGDGKIVAAGGCEGATSDFCLLRYNTNGSVDNSFGTTGKVTTAFGTNNDTALAVAIQADGKIVAAGTCVMGSAYYETDFCLARYEADLADTDSDGVLDSADLCAGTPTGAIVDENGCTSEQGIEAVIGAIEDLIAENPGTSLADKAEDGLAKVQAALRKLNQPWPDAVGAAGELEGAIGDLEAAMAASPASAGQIEELILRLLSASRLLATDAIDAAIADGGDRSKILEAQHSLDQGDSSRDSGAFKDAASKYKDAIAKAQGAH